ncbi:MULTISPECIES: helix-turn-helix transcriptional regulator [Priestia]|jgi:DNA-binding PadR family transcriptional regulator|uniref:Replication termination protein n=3 Tax=Priestia TaxID=2800373 RepID=A0A0H4KL54_9BACI|nr:MULTISPECIES: helix-turn-helix transcriptional regulator [Priestia]AKO93591.1 Replication termination protein [Priestia filamentosa]KAB2494420.1 Replication termination protein [Priestia endophytica]KYG27411.1 Replication termination protein [Priestia endophytica]MBG9814441.1 Replication termination protein [Priestia endophytica]MCM3538988.1 helix-turn-helix transcriptional regulator [Priestia endophytica]
MSEKRNPSGFLVKQRAFLKLYMITMTEQERLYGLRLLDVLREEFRPFGYRPNHSEIYKALHDLIEDGVLEQVKKKKEGMKLQEVVYYRFAGENGHEKAKKYKRQLKVELDRCQSMIQKAVRDNFGIK